MDTSIRNELVLENLPLVKYIAGKLARRLPSGIAIDDLINTGVISLMDIIDRYDSTKGASLGTYAWYGIKGSMLDELQFFNPITKTLRYKLHCMTEVVGRLEQKLGEKPSNESVADEMGIDPATLYKMEEIANSSNVVSLEEVVDVVDRKTKLPNDIADENETRECVIEAINSLKESQRLVVLFYYYLGYTLVEIGLKLHLTKQGVEKRLSGAKKKLAKKLQGLAFTI